MAVFSLQHDSHTRQMTLRMIKALLVLAIFSLAFILITPHSLSNEVDFIFTGHDRRLPRVEIVTAPQLVSHVRVSINKTPLSLSFSLSFIHSLHSYTCSTHIFLIQSSSVDTVDTNTSLVIGLQFQLASRKEN